MRFLFVLILSLLYCFAQSAVNIATHTESLFHNSPDERTNNLRRLSMSAHAKKNIFAHHVTGKFGNIEIDKKK